MTDFGRPNAADVELVDLHARIDAAITLLQHETKGRIELEREYGTLPLVECAAQQINQVFMNLLLNGVQAIDGKGTITVRTSTEPAGVRVEIEDTGAGIAPENLERIFEPGFTTKSRRVGRGLGLLIARRIVDRHGGRITVQSVRGRGSTFSVHLPAGPRAAPPNPDVVRV